MYNHDLCLAARFRLLKGLQDMDVVSFTASSCWLWLFCRRHNISIWQPCGEALSADVESEPFRKKPNDIVSEWGLCLAQLDFS
jgi:hypothetical protein